jgi:hypothetical protein
VGKIARLVRATLIFAGDFGHAVMFFDKGSGG